MGVTAPGTARWRALLALLRPDARRWVGLGVLIAVSSIIVRTVPLFRVMQERIDTVNRVLREQLTGMRVVRAFVRERQEVDRFADANAALPSV